MSSILPYQIKTSRDNLLCVGRMSIKSLIDRSCFETLHDRAPEVINFCNILEHILSFCTKGFYQSFYTVESKRHPWLFIREACKGVPESCVPTIDTMENLKGHYAKLRGWIKLSLLQKRLGEYLEHAILQKLILEKFYDPRSLLRSAEFYVYLNTLMGLTAVDFSFDLRGEDQVHHGLTCIDFTPYLRFTPSDESLLDDALECDEHLDLNSSCPWQERFLKLDVKYKREAQQKHFLEERLRKLDALMMSREAEREQFETEMKQLESVILELQVQITLLQEQYREELRKLGGDPDSIPNVPAARGVTRALPPSLLTHRLTAVEPTSRPLVGLQQFASGRRYSSPQGRSNENLAAKPSQGIRQEAYEAVNDNWDDDDYERVILFPEDEQDTSPEPEMQKDSTSVDASSTNCQDPSPVVTPDVVRRVRDGISDGSRGYYRLMDTPRDSDSVSPSVIENSRMNFPHLNVSHVENSEAAEHAMKTSVFSADVNETSANPPKDRNDTFTTESADPAVSSVCDESTERKKSIQNSNETTQLGRHQPVPSQESVDSETAGQQPVTVQDSDNNAEALTQQPVTVQDSNDNTEALTQQSVTVQDSNDNSEAPTQQPMTVQDSNDNTEAVTQQPVTVQDSNDNRKVAGLRSVTEDSNGNREVTENQISTSIVQNSNENGNISELQKVKDKDGSDNTDAKEVGSMKSLENGGVARSVIGDVPGV